MEALFDPPGQLLGGHGRFLGACGMEKIQDLRSELVGGFGTGLARHQPVQALECQKIFGFIDRRSRQGEIPGDLAQGVVVSLKGAERFIFDLQEVAGVKKPAADKEGMPDFVGVGMQGVGALEGLEFWVRPARRTSIQSVRCR